MTTTFHEAAPKPTKAFRDETAAEDVLLSWKSINMTVRGKDGKGKPLLNDVTGYLKHGEMLAIMGPSGAGKTSLMNILSGRMTSENQGKAIVTGDIELNGHRQTKKDKKSLGFVFQNDVLLSNITVRDTITFAARLRLRPRKRSFIQEMVTEVAVKLGIEKILDRKVGYGLSGGEKKRLAIAVELISSPKVLYCDEPTSGLDSTTALNLISNLKQLCSLSVAEERSGTKLPMTVIASIHQPRETIFAKFDKLLLLSKGQVVYFGRADRAISYFNNIGQQLPPFTNPADFFLDAIMCSERSGVFPGASKPVDLAELWKNKQYAEFLSLSLLLSLGRLSRVDLAELWKNKQYVEFRDRVLEIKQDDFAAGPATDADFISPGTAFVNFAATLEAAADKISHPKSEKQSVLLKSASSGLSPSPPVTTSNHHPISSYQPLAKASAGGGMKKSMREIWAEEVETGGIYASSWLTQFLVLCERSTKQQKGDIFNLVQLISILLMALFTSFVWWQTTNITDIIGLLFFINVQQSFDNLMATTRFFPTERGLMQRERSTASYRVSAYFFAKTLSDVLGVLVLPSLFAIVVYFATGLASGAAHFFMYWFIFMSTVWAAQSMGIFFSATIINPLVITRLTPLIMITFMLLGGFYVSSQNVPKAFAWVKYLSFIYWGYGGQMINHFRGREFPCSAARPGEYGDSCPISGDAVLASRDFENFSLGGALGVLWAMIVVYRWLAYLGLRYIRAGALS
eukprot:g75589.t1